MRLDPGLDGWSLAVTVAVCCCAGRPLVWLATSLSLELQTHSCLLVPVEAAHWVWLNRSWFGRVPVWVIPQVNIRVGLAVLKCLNGECQKWCLPVSDQLGGRRVKKGGKYNAYHHFLYWIKFQQFRDPPAHALKLVNVSPLWMTQVFFKKLLLLCWDLEHSFDFLQAFGSPNVSPAGFQSQMLQGLLFWYRFHGLGLRPFALCRGPLWLWYLYYLWARTRSGCLVGVMRIPACGIHMLWQQWTNRHRLQKSCEGKGMAWPLSMWERGPEGQREPKRARPLPRQAFIAFLGTLHEDGPHLLCTGSL